MTVGNGLILGARQGLQANLVAQFSGDLTLVNGDEETQTIVYPDTLVPVKLLTDYPRLKTLLAQHASVADFIPMSRGHAAILNDNGIIAGDTDDAEDVTVLFGVDFAEHQRMFPDSFVTVEGRLLQPGERGLLLSAEERKLIYDQQNFWLVPEDERLNVKHLPPELRAMPDKLVIKHDLVVTGMTGNSLESDIRVPVKGIVQVRNLSNVKLGSMLDIESFRQCFGYLSAAAANTQLSAEQTQLLTEDNEGMLFGENESVAVTETMTAHYDLAALQAQTTRQAANLQTDQGAYQFVLVKLRPGVSLAAGATQLRQAFAAAGLNIKVLDWQQSTGSLGQFTTLTQGTLLLLVLFVFLIAAIVITNTLSMAAIERTTEIAMMRAIGARKSFIRRMLLAEIGALALVFGGIGMGVGILFIWGLNALRIPMTAEWILTLVAGGDTLHLAVDLPGFLTGSGQVAVVTLISALYPMLVASKIVPLEAIARD